MAKKPQSKNNPSVFVRVEDCRERHTKIDLALFGQDGRGGIVKDIGEIKSSVQGWREGKLSGRDKAAIAAAIIMATASILVALLK